MKFGYFDDSNREYVITTPKTPLPWINYLGNQDFFTLISNTCGGYSFYKDARLLRITRYRYNDVPYDGNGKYIYIKDGNTVWNTGWQPSKTDLDSYECRHGMGYSRFCSSKDGVTASQLNFVPMGDTCEVILLDQLLISLRLFDWVEVRPLEVLDEGKLEHVLIRDLLDVDRNLLQASKLCSLIPTLSGNDLVASALLANENGL